MRNVFLLDQNENILRGSAPGRAKTMGPAEAQRVVQEAMKLKRKDTYTSSEQTQSVEGPISDAHNRNSEKSYNSADSPKINGPTKTI